MCCTFCTALYVLHYLPCTICRALYMQHYLHCTVCAALSALHCLCRTICTALFVQHYLPCTVLVSIIVMVRLMCTCVVHCCYMNNHQLSPMKSAPSYVLTSIILTTLRTDRQRPIVEYNRRGRVFAPFYGCSLKPRECYNRGPRTASS